MHAKLLICRCLRGRASSSLPPLLTARCRDSPAPAALGLCCLHPQLGTAGAPRRVTRRGELPQRGFSPPQPANYFDSRVSIAQEIMRAPTASAAPRPERLWSWPRRAGDGGKGVPHRRASGLGATNPVPLRSPVKATVRIVQASLRRSSSWRPVALCKPRWGLKNASLFFFWFLSPYCNHDPASCKRTRVCGQKKTAENAGMAKGPGLQRREFFPPRGYNRPRRVRVYAFPGGARRPRRRGAHGSAEALPACELALGPRSRTRPCGPPPLGLHGQQSLLSCLLGQASGSRDRLQQGGGTGKIKPYSPWSTTPDAPWSLGNECVPSLPAVLEIGLDIRCSRSSTGAKRRIPRLGCKEA